MSCYVVDPYSAAPNASSFLPRNVIAVAQCHVLSLWVDSTRIAHQAAAGLSIQRPNSSIEARRESSMSQHEAET
jgi:hypothetical protein